MAKQLIGRRIRALREEQNLSQDQLAHLLGFKDRQTVSAIEMGDRRVKAEELVLAMEKLDVPLDYFTDPFLLAGEGQFSWRQCGVSSEMLLDYERSAGRWIGAFRALAPQVGRETPLLRRALGLTRRSSYEEASRAGERFVAEFDLGDAPATRLANTMEQSLGILVLMVDACDGVSGAACRLPELDAILISRREVAGRRHFDLAHELFHLLTWEEMPPEHAEETVETSRNRVEQLANSFAGAVLMPEAAVDRDGVWEGLSDEHLVSLLDSVANELAVTSSALKWRLVALGKLKPARVRAIPEAALRNNGLEYAKGRVPSLFSKPFMEVIGLAIAEGYVSVRRAAALLDLPIEDLEQLFEAHGIECSIDI